MKTLVIARYNEDCSWIADVDPSIHKFIVQKGGDFPNVGREPSSFLWFIISHYDKLQGDYYFVQGKPFDHCVGLYNELSLPADGFRWLGNGDLLECNGLGVPHHGGLPVEDVWCRISNQCGVNSFFFTAGGQFAVSANVIKSKPLYFYVMALAILLEDDTKHPWCFERLWGKMFA